MNAFISAFLLSPQESITLFPAHVLIIQGVQYAVRGRHKAGQ